MELQFDTHMANSLAMFGESLWRVQSVSWLLNYCLVCPSSQTICSHFALVSWFQQMLLIKIPQNSPKGWFMSRFAASTWTCSWLLNMTTPNHLQIKEIWAYFEERLNLKYPFTFMPVLFIKHIPLNIRDYSICLRKEVLLKNISQVGGRLNSPFPMGALKVSVSDQYDGRG